MFCFERRKKEEVALMLDYLYTGIIRHYRGDVVMQIYRFDPESGKQITRFDSDLVMSRIIQTSENAHVGCMHLSANGVVGYHEAVCPQLMAIVSGAGQVRSGENDAVHVKAGEAVFWEKEEWHETKTETGLMAIVIESEVLTPSAYMPVRTVDSE